jgi:O-acetylhomoserine/O-acetylserine sulfhydrylase-like pyridoxal-dependent enzyme
LVLKRHPYQLERTQYLEHSVPLYLTSSFVFEDAEDMRASFAEEKDRNIYSRYSNPNTNEFVEKYVRWKGQLLVLLLEWLRYIQRWLRY